jgi:hypothetical protein
MDVGLSPQRLGPKLDVYVPRIHGAALHGPLAVVIGGHRDGDAGVLDVPDARIRNERPPGGSLMSDMRDDIARDEMTTGRPGRAGSTGARRG